MNSYKIGIAAAVCIAIGIYFYFRWSSPKSIPTVSSLEYPIGDYDPKRPVIDTPQPGTQKILGVDQCGFSNVLRNTSLKEAQYIIENHLNEKAESQGSKCDVDCDNVFMQELYESYLVKYMLQDENLQTKLISIYKKIYDAMRNKLGDSTYKEVIKKWEEQNPGGEGLFNVNQRFRNWSDNNRMIRFSNGNRVNPYVLRQLTGVSDFDPTTILLSSDFLKKLSSSVPVEFAGMRDYMFNNILKRARGYRTNSKNRIQPGTKKKDKILVKEKQIGITDFDLDDLILQKNTYYNPQPFVHPGRSQCNTVPLQGMYEHEAERLNIPIKCGISGSTNFWIWTALYSGVNLSLEETRLFLLSAFIVLNADGGHSLMEVLSSATMSSIFWKDYLTVSKDRMLEKYIIGSNFARNMYEITKNINPLGKRAILTIDKSKVAEDMFNSRSVFTGYDDLKTVVPGEAELRMKVESYFLQDNNRADLPFGAYTTFLDQIPEISGVREKTVQTLKSYVKKYC